MRLKCDGRWRVAGGKVAIRSRAVSRAVRGKVSFHFRKTVLVPRVEGALEVEMGGGWTD